MSDDRLQPWKDQPPKTPDEAAAASLLQEIRSVPSLSPDALARVERRVRERQRAARRLPIFVGFRPAVLAGAMGLALVIGGLTFVATERSRPSFAPNDATVAMAPLLQAGPRGLKGGLSMGEFAKAPAAPAAAPAPPAELATREWAQPPPDVADLSKRRESLNGFGALGSGYGGPSSGAHRYAPAAKAKKSAEKEDNGLDERKELFAPELAHGGGGRAGGDADDKGEAAPGGAAGATVALLEPSEKPAGHMRSARMEEMQAPSTPADAPSAAPRKDELAEGPPPPPAKAAPGPSRAFSTPPPVAQAPMANAAADSADAEVQAWAGSSAQAVPQSQAAPRSARRSDDSQLLRAEQLARSGRCPEAIAEFSPLADSQAATALVERALMGRARCRLELGQDAAAHEDLDRYLAIFPNGRFAAEARSLDR